MPDHSSSPSGQIKKLRVQDRYFWVSLIGLALALGGAYALKVVPGQPFAGFLGPNRLALAALGLGLALTLLGSAGAPVTPDTPPEIKLNPQWRAGRRRRTARFWAGLGLLLAGTCALAYVVRDTRRSPLGLDGPIVFLLGLGLAVSGSALIERRRRNWLHDLGLTHRHGGRSWWQRDGLWLLIFLTAWTTLQLHRLDTEPGYFNIDEGIIVNYGRATYAPVGQDALTSAWSNEFHPYLSCVPRALVHDLFPNRPFFGSRLVAVLVGTACLALVFALARLLGGSLAGWSAIFLLGFNQVFLTLARFGMTNLDTVALAGLWTLALAGAWRSRRCSLALLAGILNGLGCYLYYSALALTPIVLAALLLKFLVRPRDVALRWLLILVYVAGFGLAAAPNYVYFKASQFDQRNPDWHVNTVLLLSRQNLESSFRDTSTDSVIGLMKAYAWPALGGMLLWPHKGAPADYFYKQLPIFDRGVAALMLAGLGGVLVLWRRRMILMVVGLWFLCGGLLPSLLTLHAPYAPRLVIALTAGCILAGWVLGATVRRARRVAGWPLAAPLMLLVVVWTGVVSAQHASHYYGSFAKDRTQFWYTGMPWGLVDFLKTFPRDASMVYYARGPYNQFYNSVIKMMDSGFPRQTFTSEVPLPPPSLATRRTAYVFELPTFGGLAQSFGQMHPEVPPTDLRNPYRPYGGPEFRVYWLENAAPVKR